MEKNYFVHPTAVVDEPTEIGENTQIWHFSHVMSGARIGANCIIGQNAFIASGAVLGKNIKIQNNVSIFKGVVLEDDVFCGPSMVFTNVLNPRSFIPRMKETRQTLVRKGSTIGANATIVCGNTIGQYAFIGAGSVVTKDIPDYALVYGNPGKIMGWVCQCAAEITFRSGKSVCKACGKRYKKNKRGVTIIPC
ncbi:MAG: N-acetyltransferase [Deltaproteobacteria bacterium]|nr:N-acetyltransferase [Deltaproteobacteria bacterium]